MPRYSTKKILLYGLFFLSIYILATQISEYYIAYKQSIKSIDLDSEGGSTQEFYNSLVDKNQDFKDAESLFRTAKYSQAIEKYNLALGDASNSKDEGQIKYKIALSYLQDGDVIQAIGLLKEIGSTTAYTNRIRAYAIQNIGNVLYTYNTEEVKNEVFRGDPYDQFPVQDDYSLARRMIFDLAVSLYPLGVSEMRSAKWFSEEILRILGSEDLSDAQKKTVEDMKELVRQKIAHADAYLVDISDSEQERGYMSEVLYRKANVLTDMFIAGDITFPNPEDSYKQAIQLAFNKKSAEAAAKLRYAIFLAKTDPVRINEIQVLLTDFYNGEYDNTNTVRSIKNEWGGALGNKEDYLILAQIDSKFKEFLNSRGWEI